MKKILQMCISCCVAVLFCCGCDSVGTQIKWNDKEYEAESEMGAGSKAKADRKSGLDEEDNLLSEERLSQGQSEQNLYEECAKPRTIYVDVCGAVNVPGVYEILEGSRIFEVIALAGGMTEDADLTRINQAQIVSDGMKIRVYTLEEQNLWVAAEDYLDQDGFSISEAEDLSVDTKVNLNTADISQLVTLPGIGESRASEIISYRSQHGAFQTIEEIMNISGIKNAVFDKIKDKIVVG